MVHYHISNSIEEFRNSAIVFKGRHHRGRGHLPSSGISEDWGAEGTQYAVGSTVSYHEYRAIAPGLAVFTLALVPLNESIANELTHIHSSAATDSARQSFVVRCSFMQSVAC